MAGRRASHNRRSVLSGAVARKAAAVLAWLVIATAALAASATYHAQSRLSRRVVRHVLNDFVSGEIRGELRVGRFDVISPRRVVARHVQLFDPAGTRVASANYIVLRPDIRAALRGVLRFSKANLKGATIRLIESPTGSGLPTFIETFEPTRPSTGTGKGLHAIVDGISVRQVTLYGALLGLRGLRADNVRARGRIEAYGPLQIQIYGAMMDVTRPFPFVGRVDKLNGSISSDPHVGVEIFSRGHTTRDRARVRLRVAVPREQSPDAPTVVDLLIHAKPVYAETLSDVGFEWAEELYGPLRGYFRLNGPASDLRIRTSFNSAGGGASLDGRILPDRVEVWGQTRSLALDRVIRDWPALNVSGRARIAIEGPADATTPPHVSLELQPFLYSRYALPALRLEGVIEEDAFRVIDVDAPYAGGEVTGEGRIGFDGNFDLHVRGNIPQIARDPNVQIFVRGARGSLTGDVRIKSRARPIGTVEVTGNVTLRNVRYGPLTASWLSARGSIGGESMRPSVHLDVRGADLAVATYPLGDADFRLHGGPNQYTATGRFRATGERRVEFDAHVDATRERYILNVERAELAVGQLVWRGAAQNVVWHPNQDVVAENIQLASGSQRLEAKGTWRFHGPEAIDAQLQDFDLTALRAIFGAGMPHVTGRADTHMVIRGDISRPDLLFEGALRDGVVYGVDNVNAVYSLTYAEGQVALDAQVDLGERGTLVVVGSGVLDPSIPEPRRALEGGVYEVEVAVSNLDLDLVRILSRKPLPGFTGRVAGRVAASGPLMAPSFEGSLHVPEFTWPNWPALSVTTGFRYDSGVLVARVQTSDSRGELAETEGSVLIDLMNLIRNPAQGIASLETSPWRVSVRVPPRVLSYLPAPLRKQIPEGLLPLRASVTGTFAGGAFETQGDVHATADWTGSPGVLCGGQSNPRALLDARFADGVTTVAVRGFLGSRSVLQAEFAASTPLDQWLQDPSTLQVPAVHVAATMDGAELGGIPWICEGLAGPMTARLEVTDWLGENPHLEAELHSPALRVLGAPPIRADVNVATTANELAGQANVGWWGGERSFIDARFPIAWAPRTPSPAINPAGDVHIDATFERAPITPFLIGVPIVVDVAGNLTGHVLVDGPYRNPRFLGDLRLEDGFLELVGLGQQLTEIEGRMLLEGTHVRLQNVEAHDHEGRIQVNGDVDMKGLRPSRATLDIESRRFPARREGEILATLTGAARVRAQIGDDATDARIDVQRLTVALPEETARTLQALERHADIVIVGEEDAPQTSYDSYIYRIDVNAMQPFWVRRDDFAAQVRARLNVTYRDPDFLVAGNVEVHRGFFEVFGKRFVVDHGTMSFDGGREINPEVNLVATHTLRSPAGATVTVTVTGRLATPNIEFSSTESNDRGEIIAILISGRRPNESGSQASVGQEQQASEEAASFLAGLTAGVLTLTARRELGDLVPIIVIESGDEAFQSARVRAGFQADSVIPKFLRNVVRGAYVEGFFTASAGVEQPERTGVGSQGPGTGFLLELQFPYNLVGTTTYSYPDNWGLDVTWEP